MWLEKTKELELSLNKIIWRNVCRLKMSIHTETHKDIYACKMKMQDQNRECWKQRSGLLWGWDVLSPVLFNPDMTVMLGITSAMQKQTGKIQKGIQLYKEIMHIIYTFRQYLYKHAIQRGVLKSFLPKTYPKHVNKMQTWCLSGLEIIAARASWLLPGVWIRKWI